MRAMLSNPDSGVTGLRPDLYQADERWLTLTAVEEAQRILAATEPRDTVLPDGRRVICDGYTLGLGTSGSMSKAFAREHGIYSALADALRAFVVSQ